MAKGTESYLEPEHSLRTLQERGFDFKLLCAGVHVAAETANIVVSRSIVLIQDLDGKLGRNRNVLDPPYFIPYGRQGIYLYGRPSENILDVFGGRLVWFRTYTNLMWVSRFAMKYGSQLPTTSIFGRPEAPINCIWRSTYSAPICLLANARALDTAPCAPVLALLRRSCILLNIDILLFGSLLENIPERRGNLCGGLVVSDMNNGAQGRTYI